MKYSFILRELGCSNVSFPQQSNAGYLVCWGRGTSRFAWGFGESRAESQDGAGKEEQENQVLYDSAMVPSTHPANPCSPPFYPYMVQTEAPLAVKILHYKGPLSHLV